MFRQCVSFPLFYYSSVTCIWWYSNGVEYIDVKRVKRRRTRRLRTENIFHKTRRERERATSQRRGQYNKKAALVERRREEMITSVVFCNFPPSLFYRARDEVSRLRLHRKYIFITSQFRHDIISYSRQKCNAYIIQI